MTRLEYPDLEPELTLELARLTTEPRAGDKLRNFAALSDRLGLPVPPPPAAARAVSGSVARPRGLRAALVRNAAWRQLIAVGMTTGAVGFLLGLHFEAPHSQNQPLPAQAVPAATVAATHRTGASEDTTAPQLPEALENSAAPRAVPHVAEDPAATPAPIEAPHSTIAKRPRGPRPARDGATNASTTPNTARSAAFLEAVQLLGRARRALDRGEALLALGLLDEIDRRFPSDMLDEERGATRVLGLCANGESEAAVQLANRVFSGRPRSIYTRRIERSCASSALATPPSPASER